MGFKIRNMAFHIFIFICVIAIYFDKQKLKWYNENYENYKIHHHPEN